MKQGKMNIPPSKHDFFVFDVFLMDVANLDSSSGNLVELEEDLWDLIEEENDEEEFDELDDEFYMLQLALSEAMTICEYRDHFKTKLDAEIEKSTEKIRKIDEAIKEFYRFKEIVKK